MATTPTNGSPAPTSTTGLINMWAALAAVLLLTVGGFALAYNHGTQTADCVNSILGVRGQLTAADHMNEQRKINDQIRAEKDRAHGLALLASRRQATRVVGFAQYQRGTAEFIAALNGWKVRDAAITKQKNAHPLGAC